jgi:hypothetical protein
MEGMFPRAGLDIGLNKKEYFTGHSRCAQLTIKEKIEAYILCVQIKNMTPSP